MKKTSFFAKTANRALRLESLENRQMLSATPIEAGVFAECETQPAVVANVADADDAAIDLSALSLEEAGGDAPSISFARAAKSNQFELTWDAIDGADSYNLKISRDGGATWITYAKTTETSALVNGLYIGKSYSFRVYAANEAGKTFGDAVEGGITPVAGDEFNADIQFKTTNGTEYSMSWNAYAADGPVLYAVQLSRDGGATWLRYRTTMDTTVDLAQQAGTTCAYRVVAQGKYSATAEFTTLRLAANVSAYAPDQTINLTVVGSAEGSYAIKWYNVTPAGDVEIEEAQNLTSYAPTSASYPLKVVAYGEGAAEGQVSSVVVNVARSLGLTLDENLGYSTVNRSVEISWTNLSKAAEYRVYKMGEDGKWKTAAKIYVAEGEITGVSSETVEARVEGGSIVYNLRMITPNQDWGFKVTAVDEHGRILASDSVAYLPVAIQLVDDSYLTERRSTLVASINPNDGDYDFQWSYRTAAGTWRNVKGAVSDTVTLSPNTSPVGGTALQASVNSENEHVYRLTAYRYENDVLVSVSHVYAYPQTLDAPTDPVATFGAKGENFTIDFTKAEGVDSYEIQYCLDASVDYPIWITLAQTAYTDNGDGTATLTHVNGIYDYENAEYRVRSFVGDHVSDWMYV